MRALILASLILASLAAATGFVPAAAANPVPARGPVIIIDGDTVDIDGTRIRLLDIDTPETYRSHCEAELTVGLRAKERLRALLNSGAVSYATDGKHDRYGRLLARVLVNGADVGPLLLAEGYALPWRPGAAAKAERLAHWCPA